MRTEFPSLTEPDIDKLIPAGQSVIMIKMETHLGMIVNMYVVDQVPLVLEIDSVVFPSVYMLWQYPDILPSFRVWPHLITKLTTGADLMLPGVIVEGPLNPKSYGKFNKGDRICIKAKCNNAPFAVGKAEMSSDDMYMAAQRGKAIKIVHSYKDNVWSFGPKTELPVLVPVDKTETPTSSGTLPSSKSSIETLPSSETLTTSDSEENDTKQSLVSGDSEAAASSIEDYFEQNYESLVQNMEELGHEIESKDPLYHILKEEIRDTDVNEMDELLMYCFLKGLKSSKSKMELPILTSTFYKVHMLPACPLGKQLDIKETSYKKLSKFLHEMEKQDLLTLKEYVKGVENIVSVNAGHELLKKFVDLEPLEVSAGSRSNKRDITELYSVTAKVLPVFSTFGLRYVEI